MAQQTRSSTSDIPAGIYRNGNDGRGNDGRTGSEPANLYRNGPDGRGFSGATGGLPIKLDYASGFADGRLEGVMSGNSFVASPGDLSGRIVAGGAVALSWSYSDDYLAQGVVFDVYQSLDPTDLFRTAAATSVPVLTVQLDAANLAGDRYFSVIARRGRALSLPSRVALIAVPPPAIAISASGAVSAARASSPTGVGFPFGIAPTGSVFAQGGDALLRGKILQLLLTSPGERVNRPDYGTRLLDLVFDPNSEVLAATMEFTITRALQQQFADEIQLDAVRLTSDDDTLLVDISYLRKSDLRLEQVRVGVPLPPGGSL